MQKYDVAVIGSGIGGMTAGALLAHRGYKTLVVEKLGRIGGKFSTEEYEGFKLPTGAIALNKAVLEKTLGEVGVELDLVVVPKLFYRIQGRDYEMPAKGGISTLLDIVEKLEEERVKQVGGSVKPVAARKIMAGFRQGMAEPDKETMTFRDWILQYTDNDLALTLFDTVGSVVGGHPHEFPVWMVFHTFRKQAGQRDMGLPRHGHLVEMEKIAKVIRANGDIWTNCPAKRILVTGGKATGIVVQKDGSEVEIASQVVISNAAPKATVQLAGVENFDEEYLRMLRLKVQPYPVTVTFVASDRPLWPESGEPAVLMIVGARRITSIVPISNIVPEAAPPGQHLLFAHGAAPSHYSHMNKEEEIRQVTLDLEDQLPLFKKHGRILKIDPRDIDDEWVEGRTLPHLLFTTETPVKNLYNVGDGISVEPGLTGSPLPVETGRRVADTITKLIKPGRWLKL